jgi:hypothetical protein
MKEHGVFEVSAEDNIVYAVLRGSWNEETAEESSQAFKLAASRIEANRWGHIVFLDDWELGVPEIEPIISELIIWCAESGLTHAAQVYSKSMVKEYQLRKMVSQNIGDLTLCQFPITEDAVHWLTNEGFKVSDKALRDLSEVESNR